MFVWLFCFSFVALFLATRGSGGTLGLDGSNDGSDFIVRQKANGNAALENGDLDGARGLDDLEESGDSELNSIGTISLVVLLEILANRLGVAANGAGLPLDMGAGRVGLVETRLTVDFIADDESRDAKRTHTTALCVLLLHASDVPSDVVDRRRVFKRKTIRLTLDSSAINQYTAIGGEAGKRKIDVLVQRDDFVHGAWVLQFCN